MLICCAAAAVQAARHASASRLMRFDCITRNLSKLLLDKCLRESGQAQRSLQNVQNQLLAGNYLRGADLRCRVIVRKPTSGGNIASYDSARKRVSYYGDYS